jgi:hypothetical protein
LHSIKLILQCKRKYNKYKKVIAFKIGAGGVTFILYF